MDVLADLSTSLTFSICSPIKSSALTMVVDDWAAMKQTAVSPPNPALNIICLFLDSLFWFS